MGISRHRGRIAGALAAACAAVALAAPGAASALTWGGGNPPRNVSLTVPGVCMASGTSATCESASIAILDHSRAATGLGPYRLPGDFASLTPAEQVFVLSDLDRRSMGLVPFAGITISLDQTALGGVSGDEDPSIDLTGPVMGYVSNWAGGYPNALLAYQGWMYDDGPGSGNLDCTASRSSGCWGHRHNVLVSTGRAAWLMGAAAGSGRAGTTSYAMIAIDRTGPAPAMTYTWSDALRAGA